MRRTLAVAFGLLLAWELALKIMGYMGDPSAELHARILRHFTVSDIAAGRDYARAGFAAAVASFLLEALLLAVLAFTPLARRLEEVALARAGGRVWLANGLLVLSAGTAMGLLLLPLDFYFSFVLEHRFGFSNMDVPAWLIRAAKNLGLGLGFALPGVLFTLWIIRKLKFYWIFVVPATGVLFGLTMSVLFPILLLPLYYDVRSFGPGPLKTEILKLAQRAELPVSEIYVIRESQYSSHTNAFFVGWGHSKKIYLYDTLIQKHSQREILSVLAHEMGHWKHDHQVKGMLVGFLQSLLLFGLLYLGLRRLKVAGMLTEFHAISSLPLMALLYGLLSAPLEPAEAWFSRHMESQADAESLLLTNDADAFVSSEIRLVRNNKSRLDHHPVPFFVRASHPDALERIEMAEEFRRRSLH